MVTPFLVLGHAAATLFLTGVIWFVQVVHYPLMARVGEAEFVAYEAAHVRRTSWVVVAPMIAELTLAAALVYLRPAGIPEAAPWLGIAMLAGIWVSTAVLQVPAHSILERGLDLAVHRRLVTTNGVRTFLWSGRSILSLWMVQRALGAG